MELKAWLRKLLGMPAEEITVTSEQYDQNRRKMAVEAFALNTTISLISALISKCEIKTFDKWKPVKGNEWYLLNVKPNLNQSKCEFWEEFYNKLLFKSNALIVPMNGNMVIADGFNINSNVISDSEFTDIYIDDLTLSRSYRSSDVFYLRYTDVSSKDIVRSVLDSYAGLMDTTADYYTNCKGLKGTLEVPAHARGQPDFEEKYKKLMNDYFKSFFKAKNAVLPLFYGMKFNQTTATSSKNISEVTDYKNLFDDAVKRCAQAFRIAPSLISGDVAGIKEGLDYTLTACIDPLAEMVSKMLTAQNYSRREVIDGGKYIEIDTKAIKHFDIFEMAGNIDKLISSSFASVDEVRELTNMYTIGEEWSESHYMTKNYQKTKALGGETNE